jgi:hypothetical protein
MALALLLTMIGCTGLCGSGKYRCSNIYYTNSSHHPIKSERSNHFILFENGDLLKYNGHLGSFNDSSVYSLREICDSDSIRDIRIYNDNLRCLNYNFCNSPELLPEEKYFILVVASNKCIKLDTTFNFSLAFGNSGSPDGILIDALMGDVDYRGISYIMDSGDSTIKTYNIDGSFLSCWSGLGCPSFIKIHDDVVYVFDKSEQVLKKFSYEGNYLGQVCSPNHIRDMIAFFYHLGSSDAWIADNSGKRIMLLRLSNCDSKEIKTNYCFKDQTFTFGSIRWIDESSTGFDVIDSDNNCVITFAEPRH